MTLRQRRRLVICCIDGGLARVMSGRHLVGLDAADRLRPAAVSVLASIFPSSTAPAHASMLTGAFPVAHGIVGNRFWDGEPVAEILARASSPLATLHPYQRSSLTATSLVDWLQSEGLVVAAVQFPHTFATGGRAVEVPSIYCLYAPAQSLTCSTRRDADGSVTASTRSTHFSVQLDWCVEMPPGGSVAMLSVANTTHALVPDVVTRVDFTTPVGHVSFPVTLDVVGGELGLELGTAVLTLTFGGVQATHLTAAPGPASLAVEYTANPLHRFSESPRADWVADVALQILERQDPDVLLLRFNQADHAQEFLYWQAKRGQGERRAAARQQILDVYSCIDGNLGRLAEAMGDDTDWVFFSDHGIDWVETHLRPNLLLEELGWADRMVFQGDSNIAYLYCDEPLSPSERATIAQYLRALHPSIEMPQPTWLTGVGLPTESRRVGRLAVTCGPHIEFQYSGSPAVEEVQSASHGYLPSNSRMSGLFALAGPRTGGLVTPQRLVDVAAVVRQVAMRGR